MKKPRHHVTDHAIIRYLERVKGIDVEAIRRGIGRRVEKGVDMGDSGVKKAGFRYVIVDGVVVTIEKACRPARGQCRRRR